MPELWARLEPEERDPEFLKSHGYLERVADFEHEGKTVPASRLGWRITPLFAATYLGRIFDTPAAVFTEEILRPELQSLPEFVDGVMNIVEAQAKVAKDYLADGSVEAAIPPLKAILHVMAEGSYEGKGVDHPDIRRLFDRDYVLASDWYRERLELYRDREESYLAKSAEYLARFVEERGEADSLVVRRAKAELGRVEERRALLRQKTFIDQLKGTIGLDPLFRR